MISSGKFLPLLPIALVSFFAIESGHAHGTVENSRMLLARLAGPAGGTPAAWTESYYTWNQNSNNFPSYAAPGFFYADFVPDGTISSAGVNNGVLSGLNFSGLNTASANWAMTDVTAGATFAMKWFATAPHDPSHFDVYFLRNPYSMSRPRKWDGATSNSSGAGRRMIPRIS